MADQPLLFRLLRGADDLGAAEGLRRLRGAQAGAVERAHGAVLADFLDGIHHRRAGHAAAGLLRQFDGAAEDVRGDEGARRVVDGDDLRDPPGGRAGRSARTPAAFRRRSATALAPACRSAFPCLQMRFVGVAVARGQHQHAAVEDVRCFCRARNAVRESTLRPPRGDGSTLFSPSPARSPRPAATTTAQVLMP